MSVYEDYVNKLIQQVETEEIKSDELNSINNFVYYDDET